MFDIFKKKSDKETIDLGSMYVVINELGIKGYQMRHFDICKNIWKELVPQTGQADTVQGELLRQAEKLRSEAQDNGNHNWDDNYAWFCEFIRDSLIKSGLFDDTRSNTLCLAIEYIKSCGEYARNYNLGKIPDEVVNPMLFAYVDDDLYDYIEDAIAEFAAANPEKTPYYAKDFIYR